MITYKGIRYELKFLVSCDKKRVGINQPWQFNLLYFPFGLGAGLGAAGLLPRPPPDGLPVVLGAFTGFEVPFVIKCFIRFHP